MDQSIFPYCTLKFTKQQDELAQTAARLSSDREIPSSIPTGSNWGLSMEKWKNVENVAR